MTDATQRQTGWYAQPVFFVADVDRALRSQQGNVVGYDSIQIDIPDGNELVLPTEGNSAVRGS